jgi:transposase
MPRPLSIDLRKRIVDAYDENTTSLRQVASQFGVGEATVYRFVQLYRKTGSCEARPHGGGMPRRLDQEQQERLREMALARPEATIAELTAELAARLDVRVSPSTVSRTLYRLGLSPADPLQA